MDNNSFVNTFLLLGRTGVGKSKLSKILSEDESIKIGETLLPETKIPKCYNCELDDFKYSLIDTPGYDDLDGKDKTTFKHIDNFLTSALYKIKGIVLLYSFQDPKFGNNHLEGLKKILKLIPINNFWDYVIIIFTRTYTDGKSVSNLTTTNGGTVDLYAIYYRTATFYSGINKATSATATQYYNSKGNNYSVTVPAASTLEDIDEWTLSSGEYSEFVTSSSGYSWDCGSTCTSSATQYYARYYRMITVKYNANDGSGTMTDSVGTEEYYSNNTYSTNVYLKDNTFTRTGYDFVEWRMDSTSGTSYDEGNEFEPQIGESETATMYAIWSPHTYTVKYFNSTGTTPLGTSTHTYGTAKNLTTIATLNGTKSGYTFYGWTKNTTAVARSYKDGQSVSNLTATNGGTVNLYAIYYRTANFYSGINKAKKTTATQYYNSKGNNYSVTVPAASNIQEISGWTTVPDEYSEFATASNGYSWTCGEKCTSSEQNYYACYTRTMTVNYSANGGTGSIASQSATQTYYSNNRYERNIVLKENSFTKTGNHFTHWLEGSTSGDEYDPGNEYYRLVGDSASVTMYAGWAVNKVTVNYYKGTTKLGSSTHTYGTSSNLTTIANLGNGTISGYSFYGWTKTSTGVGTSARNYANGASMNSTTQTTHGTINLYAMYYRYAYVVAGLPTSYGGYGTVEYEVNQYYNPNGNNNYYLKLPSQYTIIDEDDWADLSGRGFEMLDECMTYESDSFGLSYYYGDASTASDRYYYAQYRKNNITYVADGIHQSSGTSAMSVSSLLDTSSVSPLKTSALMFNSSNSKMMVADLISDIDTGSIDADNVITENQEEVTTSGGDDNNDNSTEPENPEEQVEDVHSITITFDENGATETTEGEKLVDEEGNTIPRDTKVIRDITGEGNSKDGIKVVMPENPFVRIEEDEETIKEYTFIGWFEYEYKDNPLKFYYDSNEEEFIKLFGGFDEETLWQYYLDRVEEEKLKPESVRDEIIIGLYEENKEYTFVDNKKLYAGWVLTKVTTKEIIVEEESSENIDDYEEENLLTNSDNVIDTNSNDAVIADGGDKKIKTDEELVVNNGLPEVE